MSKPSIHPLRALTRKGFPRSIRSLLAIIFEAIRWAEHVTSLSPRARAFEKAFSALAFTLRSGFATLAVPTKLVGVKAHQSTVRRVRDAGVRFGHRLRVSEVEGRVAVSWDDGHLIGFVQTKHERWIRPLLKVGIGIYLIRVTGDGARGHTLGVNVAIGSLRDALNSEVVASPAEPECGGASAPAP